MPDLDRSIYDQLQRRAGDVRIPDGDVASVMARGRSRRRYRRGAVSVMAVAAAVALTGTLVNRSSGSHPTVVRSGDPVPTSAPASAALRWSAQPVADDLGYSTSLSAGATEYALSTSPGVAPTSGGLTAPALWSSTDGFTWQVATGPQGLSLGDLAVNDGTVYGVGTGTATAATANVLSGGVKVASSAEGKGEWSQVQLPLDFAAPPGALTLDDDIVKIAAGPTGVVAAINPGATLNLSHVLPAGVTAGNWTTTASGVELLGAERADVCGPGETTTPQASSATVAPGQANATTSAGVALKERVAAAQQTTSVQSPVGPVGCFDAAGNVVRTLSVEDAFPVVSQYSWAQLHLGPEAVDALRSEPIVFFSANGKDFQQISLPAGAGAVQSLTADAGGFVLSTNSYYGGSQVVLRSADGQHWTAHPLPALDTDVIGAATVDGQVLAVARTNTDIQVLQLHGSTWALLSIPGLPAAAGTQQNADGLAFGPLGVALVVQDTNAATSDEQVFYSPNGVTWSSADLTTLSGGQVSEVANVSVNANQVVVTVQRPATPQAGIEVGTKTPEVAVVGSPAGS